MLIYEKISSHRIYKEVSMRKITFLKIGATLAGLMVSCFISFGTAAEVSNVPSKSIQTVQRIPTVPPLNNVYFVTETSQMDCGKTSAGTIGCKGSAPTPSCEERDVLIPTDGAHSGWAKGELVWYYDPQYNPMNVTAPLGTLTVTGVAVCARTSIVIPK